MLPLEVSGNDAQKADEAKHPTSSETRALLAWLFQLLASCAWVASVIVYGSYESGDILQLLAAVCWTLSNAIAAPEAIMPMLGRREAEPKA